MKPFKFLDEPYLVITIRVLGISASEDLVVLAWVILTVPVCDVQTSWQ